MILEIALGIVLAVLILCFLPEIISGGILLFSFLIIVALVVLFLTLVVGNLEIHPAYLIFAATGALICYIFFKASSESNPQGSLRTVTPSVKTLIFYTAIIPTIGVLIFSIPFFLYEFSETKDFKTIFEFWFFLFVISFLLMSKTIFFKYVDERANKNYIRKNREEKTSKFSVKNGKSFSGYPRIHYLLAQCRNCKADITLETPLKEDGKPPKDWVKGKCLECGREDTYCINTSKQQ